jgi:ribosome-interacting GTPase 1
MSALQVIELFAGTGPDGQPVVERMQVKVNDDDSCQLVRSPAFIKGIASGDIIKLEAGTQNFSLIKRAGNLCIRVYSRGDTEALSERLAPQLEKLGGELDTETPRMLIFSIHVSCGFTTIEKILNDNMSDDTMWMYGNVYDPKDGQTPLNWWQEILKPE